MKKMKLLKIGMVVFLFSFISLLFSLKLTPFAYRLAISEESPQKKEPYLTCSLLNDRTKDFLRYHYVYQTWSPEISSRTFQTFLKMLDPAKTYFLESDIQNFRAYEYQIGNSIQNVDCRFVDNIYTIYKQRVHEYTEISNEILQKPFDFSVNDSIETDRKKIVWAKTKAELKIRIYKNLKFIVLNMKGQDPQQKVSEKLRKRFVTLEKTIQIKSNDEIHSLLLNSFALSLDPHSSFLTPVDNANFQIDFSLRLVGIGATLMNVDGYTTIDSVVSGGAADKSGLLRKGDKITAVDPDQKGMQEIVDMELDKVVQLIRGKENTPVSLSILRKEPDGTLKNFKITLLRAVVEIKDSQAKSDILKVGNKKIGIINLPSFYIDYAGCQKNIYTCRSSANDTAKEIVHLMKEKVDAILVDLRRNGGGDLNEVQRIVGLFVDNPVVAQVQDHSGIAKPLEISTRAIYNGPLGILVSRYSASASEILAGAVQDYRRGLILGDSYTFGKGSVQTVIDIPGSSGRRSDGAIHVTIAKFFRPSGQSNQAVGVQSDITIPSIIDSMENGEKDFDYYLPNTTIAPARNFKPQNRYRDDSIQKLKFLSQQRIKNSVEFKKINALISKDKKDKSTSVSLQEQIAKIPLKNEKGKDKNKLNPKIENPADELPDFSLKVIRKNDDILFEAGKILNDEIQLQQARITKQ